MNSEESTTIEEDEYDWLHYIPEDPDPSQHLAVNPEKEKTETEPIDDALHDILEGVLIDLISLSKESGIIEKVRAPIFNLAINSAATVLKPLVKHELEKNAPEDLEIEPNIAKRSFYESLVEGIDLFRERHPDIELSYKLSLNYYSLEDFTRSLSTPVTSEDLSELDQLFTPNQLAALKGRSVASVMLEAIHHRAGETFVKQKVYDLMPKAARAVLENASDNGTAFLATYSEVGIVQREVENWVAENGIPISSSELLNICLYQTNGDIGEALGLMTGFYKHKARVDQDIQWMAENVLDEYSDFLSFNFLDSSYKDTPYRGKLTEMFSKTVRTLDSYDLSSVQRINYDINIDNKVGLPYHTTHMIHLLENFPPEFIMVGVLGEYVQYGEKHGLAKFLTDLGTLGELYKIKKYLNKFKSVSTIVQD